MTRISHLCHWFLGVSLTCATLGSATAAGSGDIMAKVNGEPVTRALYDAYTRQRYPQVAGEVHEAILQELINIQLVLQESKKNKIPDRAEVAADLEILRGNYLTTITIQDHLKNNPPSESEVRKEYDNHYADAQAVEYKARHILLKSDREAMRVIAELDKGSNFAQLAEEKSIGPSAEKGGDLGWFLPEQMVPAFSAAVAKLEEGKYSSKPIRTQFGWHVILLEGKRKRPPPPFEEVKDKLTSQIQNRQVQGYINGLRDSAKIETLTK